MKRTLAAVLALATTAGGCGYFFHPERRGNEGGEIAGASLIGDLLWLIPGIVPGVVALAIDFSSGAIYYGGGSRTVVRVGANDTIKVKLPEHAPQSTLDVRVVDGSHKILAQQLQTVAPNGSVVLAVNDAMRMSTQQMFLQIGSPDGHGSVEMSLEIAR